jgi:hypothetical protein
VLVVALRIAEVCQKQVLGVWQGANENTKGYQELLLLKERLHSSRLSQKEVRITEVA